NILATPQLLTLDNVEATFESTEKIPVPTQTSSGTGAATTNTTFTFNPVGLIMTIKPQINKTSNFVKLAVKATLSDVSERNIPTAVATQVQATFERKTDTTVVVGDGDTVVLGGLIRDVVQDTTDKVPLLGDIPILGWLFKSNKK